MSIKNVDYKNILFTRSDGVVVTYLAVINDPTDLNENFAIIKTENIDTPEEMRLFYWLDKKKWTFNELNFFALNNDLCIKVTDKNNNSVLASYGNCGSITRVHGLSYGNNYN